MYAILMVTWIPSIYPSHDSHVSIYTSTMDPMGYGGIILQSHVSRDLMINFKRRNRPDIRCILTMDKVPRLNQKKQMN